MSVAIERALGYGVVDAILCHCADDETGHEPGGDGCSEASVKPGRLTPWSRTEIDRRAS